MDSFKKLDLIVHEHTVTNCFWGFFYFYQYRFIVFLIELSASSVMFIPSYLTFYVIKFFKDNIVFFPGI